MRPAFRSVLLRGGVASLLSAAAVVAAVAQSSEVRTEIDWSAGRIAFLPAAETSTACAVLTPTDPLPDPRQAG